MKLLFSGRKSWGGKLPSRRRPRGGPNRSGNAGSFFFRASAVKNTILGCPANMGRPSTKAPGHFFKLFINNFRQDGVFKRWLFIFIFLPIFRLNTTGSSENIADFGHFDPVWGTPEAEKRPKNNKRGLRPQKWPFLFLVIFGWPLGLNKTPGNRRALKRAKSLKTHLNRESLCRKTQNGAPASLGRCGAPRLSNFGQRFR